MVTLSQIPLGLRKARLKQEFLEYLRKLPMDRYNKKQLLFAWAKMVGTVVTPDDVNSLNTVGRFDPGVS